MRRPIVSAVVLVFAACCAHDQHAAGGPDADNARPASPPTADSEFLMPWTDYDGQPIYAHCRDSETPSGHQRYCWKGVETMLFRETVTGGKRVQSWFAEDGKEFKRVEFDPEHGPRAYFRALMDCWNGSSDKSPTRPPEGASDGACSAKAP